MASWLQWRNRLAHGTYNQYKTSHAGVVSSSLTWSNKILIGLQHDMTDILT